jgi:uncharacterized protein YjbJ (UPF0337 family)
MDTSVLTNKWNQVRNDVKHRWDKLTEEDVERVKGDIDELVSLVEQKYGYTRKAAESEVKRFLKQYDRTVRDVVKKVPKEVRLSIARYPGAALATALIALFVLGFLLKPSR